MTPKEAIIGIGDWLKLLVWPGTTNKVFGDGVFIVVQIPIQQICEFPAPCVFLQLTNSSPHPEHPGILYQSISLSVFVENVQSSFSESVLLGGPRISGTSQGAGLLNVETVLFSALVKMTDVPGMAKIINIEKQIGRAVSVKGNYPLATQTYILTVLTGVY